METQIALLKERVATIVPLADPEAPPAWSLALAQGTCKYLTVWGGQLPVPMIRDTSAMAPMELQHDITYQFAGFLSKQAENQRARVLKTKHWGGSNTQMVLYKSAARRREEKKASILNALREIKQSRIAEDHEIANMLNTLRGLEQLSTVAELVTAEEAVEIVD
jgi:hypothetical protein